MADPSLCRRCGKCCCRKMAVGGEIVYLPLFCDHFDPDARLCTIYERRYELNRRCLTVEEGIKLGVFPADCPFVRDAPGYRPPREQCTEDELSRYLEDGFEAHDV